jgi:hypothetical protein
LHVLLCRWPRDEESEEEEDDAEADPDAELPEDMAVDDIATGTATAPWPRRRRY